MATITYSVEITQTDEGNMDFRVRDVGDSEENRASIAFALRTIAEIITNERTTRGYGSATLQ